MVILTNTLLALSLTLPADAIRAQAVPGTLRTPLPTPRVLTFALQGQTIPQARCLEVASNSLQTVGFSNLRAIGPESDRSLYGYGEGTTAVIRCNTGSRLVLFVVSTVHLEVDTRTVGELLVRGFAQGTGISIP